MGFAEHRPWLRALFQEWLGAGVAEQMAHGIAEP